MRVTTMLPYHRSRLVAAGLALALVLGSFAACTPTTISQDQAVQAATMWFAGAHGSGAQIQNVKVLSVERGRDADGRDVWKVNIGADVIEAGHAAPSYSSYVWLDVDANSGVVTVIAEGMTA